MPLVYAVLCVLGTVLPLTQFIPWLATHGLNMPLLVQEALATPLSAFAWSDVLVSGVATAAFIMAEGRRLGMRRWWVPLAGLGVGPSLALPLFLLLRERHIQRTPR